MNISILSVFPDLYDQFLTTSLIHRAQEKGLISFTRTSFFSSVSAKERIDAPTAGSGAGMVLRPDVVQAAIEDSEQKRGKAYKIFFSPHGKKLDQPYLVQLAKTVAQQQHVMLVAGRYEGMDARVEQQYADELISLGDFVLMGGDLPAMVFLEGVLRLMPGVVGKQESVENESFSGPFVDYPEYTAPNVWQGLEIPPIVRSGNHGAVAQWRQQEAAKRSLLGGHWEWVRNYPLTSEQSSVVKKIIPPHYVVLMHTDVLVGRQEKQEGTTSVTSLDIHDIARSCATYGIKHYFLVTPLQDQQAVVNVLLDFWQKGAGLDYNKNRYEAVKSVRLAASFQEVMQLIEQQEQAKPVVVATSAKTMPGVSRISFSDQDVVWRLQRPVLFVFGTGQGLTPAFVERCDYLLPPVGGLTNFRHLSVRSAAAVILDRWLGLNSL